MKKYFSTWVGKPLLNKRFILVEMGKFSLLVCLGGILNILCSGSLTEATIGKDVPPSLQAEENEVVEPNNDELGSKMAGG